MKPVAEPRASLFVRGGALFERVDYRLIETPEEKDQLYLMRYRAYTHGGLIPPSKSERYSDRYDDAPNALTFGIYVDGELCSSIRLHVLTSERRMSCTTELFGDVLHPRLDKGEVFIDPARFVADPGKSPAFSRASLSDAAAGLSGMRVFQRRYRARAGSCRAPVVLSPGLSVRDHRRTASVSERIGKGGLDGVRFPGSAGKGLGPFSHYALERFRDGGCYSTRSSERRSSSPGARVSSFELTSIVPQQS